jgi:hypothetical protein
VKITPSNQTLILAGERGSSTSRGAASASKAGTTGSTLSRVTIVATQPDTSVLYFQADYSPDAGDAIGGPVIYGSRAAGSSRTGASGSTALGASAGAAVVVRPQTAGALASDPRVFVSGASGSSYLNLKPAEQYAFTQSILSQAPAAHYIDAYA